MSRWSERSDVPRGDVYDARWRAMEAAGESVHGEADLVHSLVSAGSSILDAGCGTGRVGIELARRGHQVVGVDLDVSMLATARQKAPELTWVAADLAGLDDADLGPHSAFDAIVLAGNVMIFLTPGSEADVTAALAGRLRPGGLLISGFQIQRGRLQPSDHDDHAGRCGLELVHRWATWDRQPWEAVADAGYAVSVHQRPASV